MTSPLSPSRIEAVAPKRIWVIATATCEQLHPEFEHKPCVHCARWARGFVLSRDADDAFRAAQQTGSLPAISNPELTEEEKTIFARPILRSVTPPSAGALPGSNWNSLTPDQRMEIVELIAVPGLSWPQRAQQAFEFFRRSLPSPPHQEEDEIHAAVFRYLDAFDAKQYGDASGALDDLRKAALAQRDKP